MERRQQQQGEGFEYREVSTVNFLERSGRVSGELCFGRARIGRLCGGCRAVDSGAGLALRFALNDGTAIDRP